MHCTKGDILREIASLNVRLMGYFKHFGEQAACRLEKYIETRDRHLESQYMVVVYYTRNHFS